MGGRMPYVLLGRERPPESGVAALVRRELKRSEDAPAEARDLVDLLSSQWSTGGEGAPWVWVRLEESPRANELAMPMVASEESLLDIRLMLDSVTDFAICALDRTGRVASWRAGAQRLTGHSHA